MVLTLRTRDSDGNVKIISGRTVQELKRKREATKKKKRSSPNILLSENTVGDQQIRVFSPARDSDGLTATDRLIEKNRSKQLFQGATVQVKESGSNYLYTGRVEGNQILATRTVSQSEQQSREVAKAIESNRQRLMTQQNVSTGSKNPLAFSFSVLPESKFTKENVGEQIALRSALPKVSQLVRSTGSTAIVSGERTPTLKEINADPKMREAFIKQNPSELRTFTEKDVQPIRTFFGIKEPGIKALQLTEYRLNKQIGIQEIAQIRSNIASGKRGAVDYTAGSVFNQYKATPIRIINRPITTAVAVGTFLLTKKVLPGTALLGSGTTTAGLTASGLAVSSLKEQQRGGSGSMTLGTGLFIGSVAVAGYGLTQLRQAFKKTAVKYDVQISEKGSVKGTDTVGKIKVDSKVIIGKTTKGSILKGKPYKETFVNKGDLTFRKIDVPGGYKKPAQQIQITEGSYFQGIKIFKKTPSGLKLIGEDFKYIDPSNTVKASLLPQLNGRTVNLQTNTGTYSTISFVENAGGNLKQTTTAGRKSTAIDLKISDVYKRNVVATDQLVRVKTFGQGATYSTKVGIKGKLLGQTSEFNPAQFVFNEKPIPLKDVNLVETTKTGGLVETRIIQPRVLEKSTFIRTGSGTISINENPLKLSLSFPKLDKSGSLQTSLTQNKFSSIVSLKPATTSPLSFSLQRPEVILGSGSTIKPLFSFNVKQDPEVNLKQKSRLRSELLVSLSPIQRTATATVQKPITDPIVSIKTLTRSALAQDQKIGLKQDQRTVQQTVQIPTGTTPISTGFGFGLNLEAPVSTPKLPPPIKLPEFALFGGSGSKRKAGSITSKSKYRPSLEAIAFDISGSVPKNITPFTLRPKTRSKRSKKKKR